jgi:AcrR family transcriptional regulator
MADGDEVIAAAHAVIRRVGMGALTLAAVAREAGISRATVYRRYASKEALVGVIVDRELAALEELVLSRLRFADEPRATIHMLVREVLEYNAGNSALQAALRIDGSILTPWLIRSGDNSTLVDIVTERAVPHIAGSPLARHLTPTPEAAVEFMVSVVFSQLLSPARHMSHAEVASYVTAAVYRPSDGES